MADTTAELIEAGRALFRAKGFKATNVAKIAAKAGIAVGSFYKYFDSKEQLFVQVYVTENEELKQRLFESVDFNDDPVTFAAKLVARNAVEMNANPILREWYNTKLMSKLEGHFQAQGFRSIHEMMQGGVTQLITQWKAEGRLRGDIDTGMIVALFKAIPYIDLHKSEIGPEYFPEILSYMTQFIMRGLTKPVHEPEDQQLYGI